MAYKVFLVEDEIVAREGIRDNVDWRGAGFEFCGEAPDGEIALPLIEATRPDILITDIKMPFMNGLQLSRLVRERLPLTRIIILSGHDEFSFAQEAIRLGVTEYLLKPVGVRDLHTLLERIAAQLDNEQRAQANLQRLKELAETDLPMRRDRFLLKLLTVGASATEAFDEGRALGLELSALAYQAIVVWVDLAGAAGPHQFSDCELAYEIVAGFAVELNANRNRGAPDALLLKKDVDEFVLILKGDDLAQLEAAGAQLAARVQEKAPTFTRCRLRIGAGVPQQRVRDLSHSFSSALLQLHAGLQDDLQTAAHQEAVGAELLLLDKDAPDQYLKFGDPADFSPMFDAYIGALSPAALRSSAIRSYLLNDIVLTAARFVHQLGGSADQMFPEINGVSTLKSAGGGVDSLREEARSICARALAYRDQFASNRYVTVIQRACDYLDQHYAAPNLTLNDVAAHVHLSPNHFSSVFGNEVGETFKEYLTRLRINKAKELLRTTALNATEICYQVGYSDPHYFGAAFKKVTGQSPRQFRARG